MRITTNWRDAVDDPGNRAVAAEQIKRDDPELWAENDEATRGQWVTDLISEWVDELRHERGL